MTMHFIAQNLVEFSGQLHRGHVTFQDITFSTKWVEI